mgnify:FL=1
MFGAIKSLLFKNKDTIAKTIWEHLGLPINAVRLKSDHKDFVHEFSEDKYLSYFFNTYQQLMLEHFFKVKGNVNQGRIIQKIMRLFDPRFEKDDEILKFGAKLKLYVKDKEAILGAEHAFIAVAIMLDKPKVVSQFAKDEIYLEAVKYYDEGGFHKNIELQKKVLGSLATGKDPSKMPRQFAIAQRFFELTFTERLKERFKKQTTYEELKQPIELVFAIKDDNGPVSVAAMKNGGACAVEFFFETKRWEPIDMSIGSIMTKPPLSAFAKHRYGLELDKYDKEQLKLKTEGIITTHDFFDPEGDVVYSRDVKNGERGTLYQHQISISKKEITILQMKMIKNDIEIFYRNNRFDCFNKLWLEVKRLNVPYAATFPFIDHKGFVIVSGQGEKVTTRLYANGKGEVSKLTKEMKEWQVSTGIFKNDKSKKILN